MSPQLLRLLLLGRLVLHSKQPTLLPPQPRLLERRLRFRLLAHRLLQRPNPTSLILRKLLLVSLVRRGNLLRSLPLILKLHQRALGLLALLALLKQHLLR